MSPPTGHEVHVWSVNLKVAPETAARLHASLSPAERERSSRFHFRHDRRRFVVAHGVLRALLGHYLALRPEQTGYVYNAYGKPALHPELGSRLRFNLTHSADLALIAIAANVDVGIDLEAIHEQAGHAEIARHFFSTEENRRLDKLRGRHYTEAFLRCWTGKEAYLKARGYGLTMPLNSIIIPQGSKQPPAMPADQTPADSIAIGDWSFYSLQPAADYIAALVIEGHGWYLRQYQWLPCPAWQQSGPEATALAEHGSSCRPTTSSPIAEW